ncbi:hypothetical protein, partial [Caldilinea sp.]|uniref:hypothetical protein n=1 Tax=Caldilinea sp. TaxID=2293560 RepID=UPI002C55DF9E|nr:hypothetical protein [Caldilinea sp.]
MYLGLRRLHSLAKAPGDAGGADVNARSTRQAVSSGHTHLAWQESIQTMSAQYENGRKPKMLSQLRTVDRELLLILSALLLLALMAKSTRQSLNLDETAVTPQTISVGI